MSASYRKLTLKKLQQIIDTATDPTIIIEASNAMAKFLPRPKQHKRRKGTPVLKKTEPSLDELVAEMEKKRKGKALAQQENEMVQGKEQAGVNGGSDNTTP